jgi:hypothetical protein
LPLQHQLGCNIDVEERCFLLLVLRPACLAELGKGGIGRVEGKGASSVDGYINLNCAIEVGRKPKRQDMNSGRACEILLELPELVSPKLLALLVDICP